MEKPTNRSGGVIVKKLERGLNSGWNDYYLAFIIVAPVVALVVGTALFYYYCTRIKQKMYGKPSEGYRTDSDELIVKFDGRHNSVSTVGSGSSYASTAALLRRSLRSRLGSNLSQVSEMDLPLDDQWEINRGQVKRLEVLGEGAFGRVEKAEGIGLPNMPHRCVVAVKMLKGE